MKGGISSAARRGADHLPPRFTPEIGLPTGPTLRRLERIGEGHKPPCEGDFPSGSRLAPQRRMEPEINLLKPLSHRRDLRKVHFHR